MTQTSAEVREGVVRALRLDLVGPRQGVERDAEYERERQPMSPSRWYLTGFLVPSEAPDEQMSDDAGQEEMGLAGDADIDGDDDVIPDKGPAKRLLFSIAARGRVCRMDRRAGSNTPKRRCTSCDGHADACPGVGREAVRTRDEDDGRE